MIVCVGSRRPCSLSNQVGRTAVCLRSQNKYAVLYSMTENEKLLLDLGVKSAAQGIKAAINTLETVHYLLVRARGDTILRKQIDPENTKLSDKYAFMDSSNAALEEQIEKIKKLQSDLLTVRNGFGQ